MRIPFKKLVLSLALPALLAGCNGFFEKDNTPTPAPLMKFTPSAQPQLRWSTSAGSSISDDYLRMNPALGRRAVLVASNNGNVSAIDKLSGKTLWRTDTHSNIMSGPGVGDGIVVVGSRHGTIVALDEGSGRSLWRTAIAGEVLAAPSIADGVVVVKAVNGLVVGLSTKDGSQTWFYQATEPSLVLHTSSSPLLADQAAIVGFANGNLAKLNLTSGRPLWEQTIAVPEGAFAIERMVDIDADPIFHDGHLYTATYQGNISSVDWASGKINWNHTISSYTGMVATNDAIYITDATGHVWAFNADNGLVNWRQNAMEARGLSAPALQGGYVVVGDAQGYLHWLSRDDGHFVARQSLGGQIFSTPLAENGVLYALNTNGKLAAYTLG